MVDTATDTDPQARRGAQSSAKPNPVIQLWELPSAYVCQREAARTRLPTSTTYPQNKRYFSSISESWLHHWSDPQSVPVLWYRTSSAARDHWKDKGGFEVRGNCSLEGQRKTRIADLWLGGKAGFSLIHTPTCRRDDALDAVDAALGLRCRTVSAKRVGTQYIMVW